MNWVSDDKTQSHSQVLIKSALAAFVIEAVLLTAVGWQKHWLAHPQKTNSQDDSRFIETEIFEMPSEAHLTEHKKQSSIRKPEVTLSRRPNKGQASKNPPSVAEENQTESGPLIAQSHGPVAIYAPAPVIPHYLQDREIHSHVVIDFYVNSQGTATPRLMSSSGNEELDAIALETVQRWKFRPAEKDGKVTESKVRLRIVFEVK